MPVTSIVGGVLSGIGASKQVRAQNAASNRAADAAAYTPYDVTSGGGNVNFGDGNSVTSGFSQGNQGLYDQLQGLTGNLFGGNSATSGYQNFANMLGNSGIQGLFGDAMGQSANTPGGQYLSTMGQLQGLFGQNQSALNGVMGAAGQNPYANYASQFMGQGQGLMGQGAGLMGSAMGLASPFFNQAQQMAGQDQSSLISNNLNLLRQQAAPQEQSQLTNMRDNLFGQGRLGAGDNGIGGANPEMQALFNSFGQNDLNRQIASNQLGLQAQQQNTSTAGLLGNLGMGFGGLANSSGQGLAGIGQNFLGSGAQLAGMGDQRQLGLLSQMQGLMGMGGNLANQSYGTATNYSDLTNNRAQQRLSNATSLFGFGNNLGQQDYTNALSGLGATQGMDQSLQQLIALAGNLGSQQAQAGANQGQFLMNGGKSASGALLSGIGNGMSNMFSLGGMFGGSKSGTLPDSSAPGAW